MPSSPKPAFGQVWRWGASEMMLIRPAKHDGEWQTICLESKLIMDWSGLADEPEKRMNGWELLSEED